LPTAQSRLKPLLQGVLPGWRQQFVVRVGQGFQDGALGTFVAMAVLQQVGQRPGDLLQLLDPPLQFVQVGRGELVNLPGRPVPDEPVHLEVPPLGQLSVRLVDHQGRALLSPAMVGFGSVMDTGAAPLRLSRNLFQQRADKPVGAEPVVLPFAAVGSTVMVFARYPYERRPVRSEAIAGPKQLGETAAVFD